MSGRPAVAAAIRWLMAFAAAVAAALPPDVRAAGGERVPPRRPNILLIVAEGHGPLAISAYGSRLARTPGIDRLAKEGMTFYRCFAADPGCGTGTNWASVAAPLRQSGYQTAFIGWWDAGGKHPEGFDHWEVAADRAAYYNPTFVSPQGKPAAPTTGYVTDLITEKALAWLGGGGRDPARPFCLVVRHVAPGRPWDTGPGQLTMYMDSIMPQPRSLFDDLAGRSNAARLARNRIDRDLTDRDLKFEPPPNLTDAQLKDWTSVYRGENNFFRRSNPQGDALTRWRYQRWIKSYLCCVAAVDDGVRRLLARLDEGGLTNDTLVAYTADHGSLLGEHGWFGAGLAYDEPLNVPLLVRWPGGAVKAAGHNTDLASTLDLAPTVLDAAGLPPGDSQGRSLVPILQGERPADWRSAVYFHTAGSPADQGNILPHRGVRTARHKLIHFERSDEWELYDLNADPEELKNLYADPAQAETVKRLKAELARLRTDFTTEARRHGGAPDESSGNADDAMNRKKK